LEKNCNKSKTVEQRKPMNSQVICEISLEHPNVTDLYSSIFLDVTASGLLKPCPNNSQQFAVGDSIRPAATPEKMVS